MSKLEFLEVTRNFKSYYKTLRDINYYLNFDFDKEKLQSSSQVITKLIFGFIRMNGTTFREMNPGQYEKEYRMFQHDFLNIIQNSGENNVDFDDFAELIDELIGIANHRTEALRKVKKTKQIAVTEIAEEIFSQEMENESKLSTDVANDEVGELTVENNNDSDQVENINAKLEEISDVVGNLSTEVEEVIIVEEASGEAEEVNDHHDDEGVDFEEVNESDDTYHFRPRRKRYR